MATKLQRRLSEKDLLFCSTCAKPIVGEHIKLRNKLSKVEKWAYHLSARECADAPHLRLDWRRHGGADGDNEFGTDISGSDGHTGTADDYLSVRFEGMESQDDI